MDSYGQLWAVDAIVLNFLTELDFSYLFMGFEEIGLLK